MERLSAEDWGDLWRSTSITTFEGLFPENYTGEILEFWKRQITGEPRQVVDLACGNGALTWIANELLNADGGSTRITGVDIADIDPFKRLGRKRARYPAVSFVGRTPAEKLPFEDCSVDLVVSQYGLEYSDLGRSIPEIGRVLGERGRLCAIMHLRHSDLVKAEEPLMLACRAILEGDRLHERYLELDRLLRETDDDSDPRIPQAWSEIHLLTLQARERIRRFRWKGDAERYLSQMQQVFSDNTPRRSRKREKAIRAATERLATFVRRQQDLNAAALTPAAVDRLVGLLEREGLEVVERRDVHLEQNRLCGLGLAAVRRGRP